MPLQIIREYLRKTDLDGWLLYDFSGSNEFFYKASGINAHLTRRSFFWIPKKGDPVLLLHKVEEDGFGGASFRIASYLTVGDLVEALRSLAKGKIAMEIDDEVPYVSKVDASGLHLVSEAGIRPVSSKVLIQLVFSRISEALLETHLKASHLLDTINTKAFEYIRMRRSAGKPVFEGDVALFITDRIKTSHLVSEHGPIVAFGENTASPHYRVQGGGRQLGEGDPILIDLWGKTEGGIYADFTYMGVCGKPSSRHKEVFQLVLEAQKIVFAYIKAHLEPEGWKVDHEVQHFFAKKKVEKSVFHRTGHNIHESLHGPGAHLDSIEIKDTRPILPMTVTSVEPALYLADFGARLENNIYTDAKGKPHWSRPLQTAWILV
ncbi:MAG: hypothetical protein A3F09_03250 [Chlamydiae bacterium RIFCSPHIGHO2_12_FULL_49_11]|nr:MAG: hypothetical protein A3F09_03250 [Chlamydiae bacterium RIFCSPHIGHO2_12_FULL_49_11]